LYFIKDFVEDIILTDRTNILKDLYYESDRYLYSQKQMLKRVFIYEKKKNYIFVNY